MSSSTTMTVDHEFPWGSKDAKGVINGRQGVMSLGDSRSERNADRRMFRRKVNT